MNERTIVLTNQGRSRRARTRVCRVERSRPASCSRFARRQVLSTLTTKTKTSLSFEFINRRRVTYVTHTLLSAGFRKPLQPEGVNASAYAAGASLTRLPSTTMSLTAHARWRLPSALLMVLLSSSLLDLPPAAHARNSSGWERQDPAYRLSVSTGNI